MRLNYNQEKVVGIISLLKSKRPKDKECEATCLKVRVQADLIFNNHTHTILINDDTKLKQ